MFVCLSNYDINMFYIPFCKDQLLTQKLFNGSTNSTCSRNFHFSQPEWSSGIQRRLGRWECSLQTTPPPLKIEHVNDCLFFCGGEWGVQINLKNLFKNTAVWNSRTLTPGKSMQTMFSDLDIQQYALCLASHAAHFFYIVHEFMEEAQEHQRHVDNSLLNSLSFATQALFRLKGNLLQCFSIGWTVVREREREYAMWQQWSETWNSCEYNGQKPMKYHNISPSTAPTTFSGGVGIAIWISQTPDWNMTNFELTKK